MREPWKSTGPKLVCDVCARSIVSLPSSLWCLVIRSTVEVIAITRIPTAWLSVSELRFLCGGVCVCSFGVVVKESAFMFCWHVFDFEDHLEVSLPCCVSALWGIRSFQPPFEGCTFVDSNENNIK